MTNMQPNLREQMLMQGQVDGVFGYVNTIRFSAKLMGVEDKQLRFINYGDYGMDLYSNAIIVSKKLVKEKPEAVRGLVRAINKGVLDTLKDPDAAVAAVAKREALIKIPVERERLDATLKDEMNHPEIAKIGLGNVDMARLKKSIDILVDANALPRTPSVDEIFTPALPAAGGRPAEEAVLRARRACRANDRASGRTQGGRTQDRETTHGLQSRRAGRGDHRARQGNGCGHHQGLRGGRIASGAHRPRHRGDRAGGRRRSAPRAPRRSSCPATSPTPSSASAPPRRRSRPTAASTSWSTSPAAPARSARPASRPRPRSSTTSSRST